MAPAATYAKGGRLEFMRLPRFVIIATGLCVSVACSDGSSDKPADKRPSTTAPAARSTPDAGQRGSKPTTGAATATRAIDAPRPDGFHLDDGKVEYYRPKKRPVAPRVSRRIYLNLVSTPAGAIASIDGQRIGATPTYWEGRATGKARYITFVLPGYVMKRYRFVPVTSGTVHAPLERVTKMDADVDAGVEAETTKQ